MDFLKKLNEAKNLFMNVAAQSEGRHNPDKVITPGMPELLRSAAAQTAVLLENRVLPLAENTRVSVFGRVQLNWAECRKCAAEVAPGDHISLRGLGKCTVEEVGNQTKKGRIFVSIKRYL